jgi:hypothetical protein
VCVCMFCLWVALATVLFVGVCVCVCVYECMLCLWGVLVPDYLRKRRPVVVAVIYSVVLESPLWKALRAHTHI